MVGPSPTFETYSHWYQWYFYGVTSQPPSVVVLPQAHLQSLFSLVQVTGVISTPALIDPKLIINAKGTTVWALLFLIPYHNDRSALEAAAKDKSQIFVPPEPIRASFASHVNWPPALLDQYPIDLRTGFYFLLPFLLHRSQRSPQVLARSMKSPDGSLEIFGHSEFDDSNPAKLLQRLSSPREHLDGQAGQS